MTDHPVGERRLLASRSASVVFLTGLAHRSVATYFYQPFDAVDPRAWSELTSWIAECVNPLVMACVWVRSTLETGSVDDLRKVCSATHHAAYNAWPTPHEGSFRARAALSAHDATFAAWSDWQPASSSRTVDELLMRVHTVLAPELKLAGVPSFGEEDVGIGVQALPELLQAEWSLWDRGLDDAAARINLARSLVGAAAAAEWSESRQIPEAALSAAEAGVRCLEQPCGVSLMASSTR